MDTATHKDDRKTQHHKTNWKSVTKEPKKGKRSINS